MLQGLAYFSITWQVRKSSYSQVFPWLELRWDHSFFFFFFLLYLTAFGRSLPIFVCVCVCVCVCELLSCPFSHFLARDCKLLLKLLFLCSFGVSELWFYSSKSEIYMYTYAHTHTHTHTHIYIYI